MAGKKQAKTVRYTTVTVEVVKVLDKRLMVDHFGKVKFVPKSVMKKRTDLPDGRSELVIPEWLYKKEYS